MNTKITKVAGAALVLRGNDIDTDRIIPARFLKAITFDGLEAHVFEDERRESTARAIVHPFDDPARRGSRILLVNANFGCGSSREHAPQAISRWGIQAIVAESFAEIFFGNALMIGLPCVTVSPAHMVELMRIADRDAHAVFSIDLERGILATGTSPWPIALPAAAQHALTSGEWDATALLLDRYGEVADVGRRLPYRFARA